VGARLTLHLAPIPRVHRSNPAYTLVSHAGPRPLSMAPFVRVADLAGNVFECALGKRNHARGGEGMQSRCPSPPLPFPPLPSALPLQQKRGKCSSVLILDTSPASQAVSNPRHKNSRTHDLSALKTVADFPGSAVGNGVGGEGDRDERQLSISHLNEMLHPLDGRSVCLFPVFPPLRLSIVMSPVRLQALQMGPLLAVVCCLSRTVRSRDYEISTMRQFASYATMCVLCHAQIKRKVPSLISRCNESYRL